MRSTINIKQQNINPAGLFNGNHLKWIAITAMLIDHVAAGGFIPQETVFYGISRAVGRIAFPLFAFLLVQGYQHTSNQRRYIVRLLGFAVLSEVPFNLAFYGRALAPEHQNIFFTLSLGLAGIGLFERYGSSHWWVVPPVLLFPPLFAQFFAFDYGLYGIVIIYLLAYTRDVWWVQLGSAFVLLIISHIAGVFALIPITLYNGRRGKQNKGLFYVIYPLHLVLIALLRLIV